MNSKQFENMKKDIIMNMKMMDATIKGITETPEYKENSIYNDGVRDALAIVDKYRDTIVNEK